MSTLTVKVVPKFQLITSDLFLKFQDAIFYLENLWTKNSWAEFEYFPACDMVLIGTANHLDGKSPVELQQIYSDIVFTDGKVRDVSPSLVKLTNNILNMLSSTTKPSSSIFRIVQRTIIENTTKTNVVGRSYEAIAQNDILDLLHYEMDLAIPISSVKSAVLDLRKYFVETNNYGYFPIDIRAAKADKFWLSPGYGTDVAWFDFLEARSIPTDSVKKFYDVVRQILAKYK